MKARAARDRLNQPDLKGSKISDGAFADATTTRLDLGTADCESPRLLFESDVGAARVWMQRTLTGLAPGSLYHVRVAAVNAARLPPDRLSRRRLHDRERLLR